MSSVLPVGGRALDKSRPDQPGCKKYDTTSNNGTNEDDTDTDDSDEELGNMIYESSRTAKKFREQEAAERITESKSRASTKHISDAKTNGISKVSSQSESAGSSNLELDCELVVTNKPTKSLGSPAVSSTCNRNSPWRETTPATKHRRINGECKVVHTPQYRDGIIMNPPPGSLTKLSITEISRWV